MARSPLSQADQYLPEDVMRTVGALRTYASRMSFYLSVPNTLMIATLFYHQSSIVRDLFPTVYHWVGFILVGVVPGAVFVDRFLLHPAEITYNAHQASREARNPVYRELLKVSRQLDRLEGADAPGERSAGGPDGE